MQEYKVTYTTYDRDGFKIRTCTLTVAAENVDDAHYLGELEAIERHNCQARIEIERVSRC